MREIRVKIRQQESARGLPLPKYQTSGAAGLDLPCTEDFSLLPGQRMLVGTGLEIEIPPGFEAQVRPRSGLALRHGITCLNSPGTIDSDYRGEIKVILVNLGEEEVSFRRGDRIAQLVFAPVVRVRWRQGRPGESDRGDGGFGHSGL